MGDNEPYRTVSREEKKQQLLFFTPSPDELDASVVLGCG
jgi:hypothetical protein